MANYTRDGATALAEASRRSYGALKRQLQAAGTPTRQHNVGAKKGAAKKAAPKKTAEKKPAAKTTAKKSAAKKTAKKA